MFFKSIQICCYIYLTRIYRNAKTMTNASMSSILRNQLALPQGVDIDSKVIWFDCD